MNYQLAQERGENAQIAMPEVKQEEVLAVAAEDAEQELEETTVPQEQPLSFSEQLEMDFKDLRAAKKRTERERDEAVRLLQELKNSPKEITEEEDLKPDDFVQWGQVENKIKKLEQRIEKMNETSSHTAMEMKLKAQFPDIEKVVSLENLEILKESFPLEAAALDSIGNLYHKAVMARTMIKNLGIHKEKDYKEDIARVKNNLSKPRASASISPQASESPLTRANSFANGLTKELQEQLLREMSEARKGL